jgi:hypothetical protein
LTEALLQTQGGAQGREAAALAAARARELELRTR